MNTCISRIHCLYDHDAKVATLADAESTDALELNKTCIAFLGWLAAGDKYNAPECNSAAWLLEIIVYVTEI